MHGRLALLLIAAACSKRANEQPPSTTTTDTPRLYTEAELATYEKALLARLAETATRTCVRPIVREPGEAAVADRLQASLDTRDRSRLFAGAAALPATD